MSELVSVNPPEVAAQPGEAPALELLVRRARSLAALTAFAFGSYLALTAGHEPAEAALRGLAAGALSAIGVWAVALAAVALLRRA